MSPNLHRRVAGLESKSPARKLPPLRVVLVGIEPLLSADGNRVLGPGKEVGRSEFWPLKPNPQAKGDET